MCDARDCELRVRSVLHVDIVAAARVVGSAPPPAIAEVGDRLCGARLQLAHRRRCHGRRRRRDMVVEMALSDTSRVLEVDIAGHGRDFTLGFEEAGLQVDDVVAQLVVLGLDGLEILVQHVVVADLLFEFFDVAFLALAECSLGGCSQVLVSWVSLSFEPAKKSQKLFCKRCNLQFSYISGNSKGTNAKHT